MVAPSQSELWGGETIVANSPARRMQLLGDMVHFQLRPSGRRPRLQLSSGRRVLEIPREGTTMSSHRHVPFDEPPVFWGEISPSEHIAQFYDTDAVFLDTLGRFHWRRID